MKFEDFEDAEDFVKTGLELILWGLVIGFTIIWLGIIWGNGGPPPEPHFWLVFENLIGVTW